MITLVGRVDLCELIAQHIFDELLKAVHCGGDTIMQKYIIVHIDPPARYRIVPDAEYTPTRGREVMGESTATDLSNTFPSLYTIEQGGDALTAEVQP